MHSDRCPERRSNNAALPQLARPFVTTQPAQMSSGRSAFPLVRWQQNTRIPRRYGEHRTVYWQRANPMPPSNLVSEPVVPLPGRATPVLGPLAFVDRRWTSKVLHLGAHQGFVCPDQFYQSRPRPAIRPSTYSRVCTTPRNSRPTSRVRANPSDGGVCTSRTRAPTALASSRSNSLNVNVTGPAASTTKLPL